MPLFRKNKSGAEKPPRDGPEEWAAKARAIDEEVRHQRETEREAERVARDEAQLRRASEAAGGVAVNSVGGAEHSVPVAAAKAAEMLGQPESRKEFFPIEVLNEEFLRHFAERRGYLDGKFIRVGDTIFTSNSVGMVHKDILEFAKKAMQGRELEDTGEDVLGPKGSGLVDAGKYDAFFDPTDAPSKDGTVGRFRIFGSSAGFGYARQESRDRTVEIAAQVLGEHIRTEENRHKS